MAVYLWGAGSSVSDREIGHSGRRSIGVPSAARRKLSCSRLDKTLVERRIASLYNAVATVHHMIWLNSGAIAPKAWISREAAIICPIWELWSAPAQPGRSRARGDFLRFSVFEAIRGMEPQRLPAPVGHKFLPRDGALHINGMNSSVSPPTRYGGGELGGWGSLAAKSCNHPSNVQRLSGGLHTAKMIKLFAGILGNPTQGEGFIPAMCNAAIPAGITIEPAHTFLHNYLLDHFHNTYIFVHQRNLPKWQHLYGYLSYN
jgi:hypothetical protein